MYRFEPQWGSSTVAFESKVISLVQRGFFAAGHMTSSVTSVSSPTLTLGLTIRLQFLTLTITFEFEYLRHSTARRQIEATSTAGSQRVN